MPAPGGGAVWGPKTVREWALRAGADMAAIEVEGDDDEPAPEAIAPTEAVPAVDASTVVEGPPPVDAAPPPAE